MNLYLDCEFNGFRGKLISMAIVADDGREWYEVIGCENPTTWVAENVMPILGKSSIDMQTFQQSLYRWLSHYNHIHIIADWPEDIQHFCAVLITGAGRRLKTPPLTLEIVNLNVAVSSMPHNALHDARAIRTAFNQFS